ncbi:LutC/YkgG family protein [Bacillus testis]|uniref:LutC/YkgG family protein n=1 Tax=Bacillus testis TaxID=1622072 RepID=UPI00067EE913|nr:lactate utilization protein C [Bacillus testis]
MKGTIQNRDAFLDKIAASLGRQRKHNMEKPHYRFNPQAKTYSDWDENQLIEMFRNHCRNIHTDYYSCKREQCSDILKKVISQFGGGPIIVGNDGRFGEYGCGHLLAEELPSEGETVYTWNPELKDENIERAERSNIGITFSEITLAESGTVVLFSSPDIGRSISLLPTTYIAIVPKSSIVPRMTQAAQMIRKSISEGKTVASCVNFITGPSNSADIEMNLVVGVHGPVRAAYIVVEDC